MEEVNVKETLNRASKFLMNSCYFPGFHTDLAVSLSSTIADALHSYQSLRDLFRMKMRWKNVSVHLILPFWPPSTSIGTYQPVSVGSWTAVPGEECEVISTKEDRVGWGHQKWYNRN